MVISMDAVEEKKDVGFVLKNFRFTKEEVEELEKAAAAAHMTQTAFIKSRLFVEPRRKADERRISERLFDVEKELSLLARRIDGAKKDSNILVSKANALTCAVIVFGCLSVCATIGAAVVLRRLLLM